MKTQEFLEHYKDKENNLADIQWDSFPEELKVVCWKFICRWFEESSVDDLREISGFDDMTLEDFLSLKERGLM